MHFTVPKGTYDEMHKLYCDPVQRCMKAKVTPYHQPRRKDGNIARCSSEVMCEITSRKIFA